MYSVDRALKVTSWFTDCRIMSQHIQNALPLFKWRFVSLKPDITTTGGNSKFSYFIWGRPAPHSVSAGEFIDSYAFLAHLYQRGGFKMAVTASQQVRYFSLAFIALLALLVRKSLNKVWALCTQSLTCKKLNVSWTEEESCALAAMRKVVGLS